LKWDDFGMDFITSLPRSPNGNDAICLVVDRSSKVAHFLLVKTIAKASQLADLYISKIVSLHGVPRKIISDRGSLFTSRFWECFQNAMGTRLSFSTASRPETGGQVERLNQILEDMLCSCALIFWNKLGEVLALFRIILQQ
jgi:hypothetical protein